jgi:hypothetical protein
MQEWRRQAIGQVPLLKRYFRRIDRPMVLWIELHMDLWRLCGAEHRLYGSGRLNREAIRQVYGFAQWCYFRSGDEELREAVAYAFYEHLLLDEDIRRTVPLYLSASEFKSLETVFRYHLDTEVKYSRFRDEFYATLSVR